MADRKLDVGHVVCELRKSVDGEGGGQPFFVATGGEYVDGIVKALDKAVEFVK